MVGRLLEADLERADKVSHLFWLLLGREPTSKQRRLLVTWLTAQADESAAWLDVWWVLKTAAGGP